jgi:hypothetical protein
MVQERPPGMGHYVEEIAKEVGSVDRAIVGLLDDQSPELDHEN